jgi:hypothetical protein
MKWLSVNIMFIGLMRVAKAQDDQSAAKPTQLPFTADFCVDYGSSKFTISSSVSRNRYLGK